MPLPREGDRLRNYLLLRRLAAGGMGEVFLARQEGGAGFARLVVVKRLLPHLVDDLRYVELFHREARLSAVLGHANVVHVIELFEHEGVWHLAMELIRGRTVRATLLRARERGLSLPHALSAGIVSQVLRGLHHAHALRGPDGAPLHIVHRDVSPENVLLGFDGAVKLTDFGLARAMAGGDTPAQQSEGVVRGKLAYLAPEQLAGGLIDARTDQFAAAVMLVELISGRDPFAEAQTPAERSAAIARGALAALDCPAPLADAARRGLAVKPDDRWPTAGDFADALDAWMQSVAQPFAAAKLADFLESVFGAETKEDPIGATTSAPVTAATQALASASAPQGRSSRGWILGALLLVGVVGVGVAIATSLPTEVLLPPVEVDAGAPVSPVVVDSGSPVVVQAPVEPDAGAVAVVVPATAKKGLVLVHVNPWAEVSWNGKKLGVTPLKPFELPVGNQRLTLVNPELKVERVVTVHVEAGRSVELRVDLEE